MNSRFFLLCCVSLIVFQTAVGSVPSIISYQGRLTLPSGDPVTDGVYALKFTIYDASLAGNQLWSTSGSVPLQVTDGLFSYSLGTLNPLPDSLSNFDSLWVGITVNLDSEISPRTRLSSSLYAFRALKADRADTATHSLDRTIDAGDLVVGILSTDRYSAYSDLVAEGKVGDGADQVASGNHSHTQSGLSVLKDTVTTLTTVGSGMGETVVKSVTLLPGLARDFIRIHVIYSDDGVPVPEVRLRINGDFVLGQPAVIPDAQYIGAMAFKVADDGRWIGSRFPIEYTAQAQPLVVNSVDPLVITITAQMSSGSTEVTIHSVILEFD